MLGENIESLCRTCMKESHSYSPIYYDTLYDDSILFEVINDVCQLEVSISDELPKYVCSDCSFKLSEFKKFKIRSHEVRASLQRLKENMLNFYTEDYSGRSSVEIPGSIRVKAESEDSYEAISSEIVEYEPFEEYVGIEPDDDTSEAVEEDLLHLEDDTVVEEEELEFPVTHPQKKLETEEAMEEIHVRDYEVSTAPVCLPFDIVANPEGGNANRNSRKSYINKGNGYWEIELFDHEIPRLKQEDMDAEMELEEGISGASVYYYSISADELNSELAECNKERSWEDVDSAKGSNSEGVLCTRNLEGCEIEVSEEPADVAIHSSDDTKENGEEFGIKDVHSLKGRLRRKTTNINKNVTYQIPKSKNDGESKRISNESDFGNTPLMDSIANTSSKKKVENSDKKTADKPGLTSSGINSREYKGRIETLKRFICDTCGKGFHSKWRLVLHVRIHINILPYKCSICSKAFVHQSGLLHHNSVHSIIGGQHVCGECGKSFKHLGSLRRHKKTHGNRIPYPCINCGKVFMNSAQLQEHLKVHGVVKTLSCKTCGKYFSSERSLKEHEVAHKAGQVPYSCSICKMSFGTKKRLTYHHFKHNNFGRYKCSKCDKGFTYKSTMQQHMATHSVERPFKCPNCDAVFKHRLELKPHMQFSCKGR